MANKVKDAAKAAAKRTKKALDAAEPVADSLLTRLAARFVASEYTVPWLLGAAALVVAVLVWVVWWN